ncbi:hypothetical protein Poly51_56170 [Rubripirellula tenax]|uniref:DUF4412 domain-containing protein n=1 Tax=Rubripirellula tenax TaxID=2528015 RepID=A0A5C6EER7_9BACT|nr:hypothetical protein [Rubripirellula tenax]TWU46221.1 hypothetical protein Poly51_56170 [Rubripirellula tenax]
MSSHSQFYRGLSMVVAIAVGCTLGARPSSAEDRTFCVTVKTFLGTSADASAEHRIIFDNGLIYDLPQLDPATVTVYDPAQGRVTMLDRPRQVQSSIRIDDLIEFTSKARAAATTDEQRAQLGLNSKVKTSDRMIGYMIQFSGATYHTSTQKPADPKMASEFGQFFDLASRLNLVRNTWLPPFARMTLNDRLTSSGEIPLETTLTIKRGEQTNEYRTTTTIDGLADRDRTAIDEVRGMMTLYKEVAAGDFPDA